MARRAAAAGQDVFAHGAPQAGSSAPSESETRDRVEFLWACIALFEGDWSSSALALSGVYDPRPADVYTVEDARARVRRHMADATPAAHVSLADLPPQQEINRPLASREDPAIRTRHRSAWSSTLMACLKMAKQGELAVEQPEHSALPAFRGR